MKKIVRSLYTNNYGKSYIRNFKKFMETWVIKKVYAWIQLFPTISCTKIKLPINSIFYNLFEVHLKEWFKKCNFPWVTAKIILYTNANILLYYWSHSGVQNISNPFNKTYKNNNNNNKKGQCEKQSKNLKFDIRSIYVKALNI